MAYHSPFDITKKKLKWRIEKNLYAYYLTNSRYNNPHRSKTLINLLRNYIIMPPMSSGTRILDVGCGNGHFLYLFRQNGWETHGTEISEISAKYAESLGNKIFNGELKAARYPRKHFDVIVINHVLEHIANPREMLLECYNILKNDGTLIVATPNRDCFDSRFLSNSWHDIHVPCHLYLFNIQCLKTYLQGCNFKVHREQYDPVLKSIFQQFYPLNPYLKRMFINLYMNEKYISRKNLLNIFYSLMKVFIIVILYKPFYLLLNKNRMENFSKQFILYAKK
jgi:SAM-dependent methyltransferase